jgi:hypothetical protein
MRERDLFVLREKPRGASTDDRMEQIRELMRCNRQKMKLSRRTLKLSRRHFEHQRTTLCWVDFLGNLKKMQLLGLLFLFFIPLASWIIIFNGYKNHVRFSPCSRHFFSVRFFAWDNSNIICFEGSLE